MLQNEAGNLLDGHHAAFENKSSMAIFQWKERVFTAFEQRGM